MRWLKIIGIILLCLVVLGGGAFYFLFHPALTVDENNPPKFIQANFIDLSKVFSISKYRSGEGHDFSGNGETCRSMKHYFSAQPVDQAKDITAFEKQPDPSTGTAIYAPMDGTITQMSSEKTPIGKQIYIRSKTAPNYTVRIFHTFPVDGIKLASKVKAGQLIGYLNQGQGTDIAVQATSLHGTTLFSYFQVMPDSVFAAYKARGAKSKDDFIISKAERDAKPLQCNGEQFAQNYSSDPNSGDDIHLSGYVAPDFGQQGPGNGNGEGSNGGTQGSSTQSISTPPSNYGNNIPQNQSSPTQKNDVAPATR